MRKPAWLFLVALIGSCGGGSGAHASYPTDTCAASGCGRVTTLGVLHDKWRNEDGTIDDDVFYMIDLEKKDPKGLEYVYVVSCDECPFEIGKRYLARLETDQNERLHSILWNGSEILATLMGTRRDRLSFTLFGDGRWTCDQPGSSWVVDGDAATCKPGPGAKIAWADPDPVLDVPGCSPGYPKGLADLNWGPDSQVTLLIRTDGWEEYENIGAFNQDLVDQLRAKGPSGSYSNTLFALADGPPQLFVDVSFQISGQYAGMTIDVKGPPDALGILEGGEAVPLFQVVLQPVYSTPEKLIGDAAAALYERLWRGWTCDAGGAKPQHTLAEICAEHPDSACTL